MRNFVFSAWLLTGFVVFVLLMTGAARAWVVAGLLLIGWGCAVAANYRGSADAMPTRMGIGPLWQDTSPAMIRLIFAVFALVGLLFLFGGISNSA